MKLTVWNIKHLGRPISNPQLPENKRRLKRISDEIIQIDPDILCIVEAPGDPTLLQQWINLPINEGGLDNNYSVQRIEPETKDILDNNPANVRSALQNLYEMQGNDNSGNQWIWFLVKNTLLANDKILSVEVQKPSVWQGLTEVKRWNVHFWGNSKKSRTNHWRHPQILVLKIKNNPDPIKVEIIGAHLKSKINTKRAFDSNNNLTEEYEKEALRARVKLATEANDIRQYIIERFEIDPDPRIIVCGDMNDGPGKKYFERQYLFFDLISNIQGNIFEAHQFLNHALFDFKDDLRWSTKFNDRIEKWARVNHEDYKTPTKPVDSAEKQLLDHILFTQAFVNDSGTPRINPHAGKVEHDIHGTINAPLNDDEETSDHAPVSVEIEI